MASWSISPTAGGASIDNNGNATFPANTGENDIVYTITYTDDNGCTTSTTYTVAACAPSSECNCSCLVFPASMGSRTDEDNPYYTDNDTDSSSPSYGQPLLILPAEGCDSYHHAGDCCMIPFTVPIPPCHDDNGDENPDEFELDIDVPWIDTGVTQIYKDEGLYVEWHSNDCDYDGTHEGPRGLNFRANDGHINIKLKETGEICKAINVAQRTKWETAHGTFQLTGNGFDYIRNEYSSLSLGGTYFSFTTERPGWSRPNIEYSAYTMYMCDHWTDSYDSQRICNLDWLPTFSMSMSSDGTITETVGIPRFYGQFNEGYNPSPGTSSTGICSNQYGCTRDMNDSSWKEAHRRFVVDCNYPMNNTMVSTTSFASSGYVSTNIYSLVSGGSDFLYLQPNDVYDDNNGHYTVNYTGKAAYTPGLPTVSIKLTADINPLSVNYTIDFNIIS